MPTIRAEKGSSDVQDYDSNQISDHVDAGDVFIDLQKTEKGQKK